MLISHLLQKCDHNMAKRNNWRNICFFYSLIKENPHNSFLHFTQLNSNKHMSSIVSICSAQGHCRIINRVSTVVTFKKIRREAKLLYSKSLPQLFYIWLDSNHLSVSLKCLLGGFKCSIFHRQLSNSPTMHEDTNCKLTDEMG